MDNLPKVNLDELPDNPYLLFTPGPLTTTKTVKATMLTDWGSREIDYKNLVEDVRKRLLKVATKNVDEYTVVLMQGSGTFCVESVIGTSIPKDGKLLVLVNGSYGKRICDMAKIYDIDYIIEDFGEMAVPSPERTAEILTSDSSITHVACIHSETTTGILNPINEIAEVVKKHNKVFIVDAMSSFGGVELDVGELGIDYLVSSANKNIQGVPGFGYIIAKTSELKKCKGNARSLSLDMYSQWERMERMPGSFRFTSPVHAIRAFHQALIELEEEGGVAARSARYWENEKKLVKGMKELGYSTIDLKGYQGPIITTFLYPNSEKFDFMKLYNGLKERGCVIYPGKLTEVDTFRIGTIGTIKPKDVKYLLYCIKDLDLV